MNINRLFDDFSKLKVLVLGDSMIDAYYYGKVERISPEAPVPIVNLNHKEHRLGGAANVALNLKALGATPMLCSLCGMDESGEVLKDLLEQAGLDGGGMVMDQSRDTTVKTRIIGNHNQMLRIDEEDTHPCSSAIENALFKAVDVRLDEADVVIFQDYNKGTLTQSLIERVVKACLSKGVKTVVDPKFNHFFDYKDVTLFKPNRIEIAQAYNIARFESTEEVIALAKQLRSDLNADRVLITLSEEGVAIVNKGGSTHLPAHPRKVVDVSGAGDSALSAAALCVALNCTDEIIAEIANLAGGLVCERSGVVPIDRNALLDELLAIQT